MPPFGEVIKTDDDLWKAVLGDRFASVAGQGHKIYMSLDCNVCHGGGGGSGMAAPLTNPIWIYGNDDDTLFRLITLGTGSLSPGGAFQKQGYTRKGSEAVVGPRSSPGSGRT
jgi:mono/diheme cytochrome c family protein